MSQLFFDRYRIIGVKLGSNEKEKRNDTVNDDTRQFKVCGSLILFSWQSLCFAKTLDTSQRLENRGPRKHACNKHRCGGRACNQVQNCHAIVVFFIGVDKIVEAVQVQIDQHHQQNEQFGFGLLFLPLASALNQMENNDEGEDGIDDKFEETVDLGDFQKQINVC